MKIYETHDGYRVEIKPTYWGWTASVIKVGYHPDDRLVIARGLDAITRWGAKRMAKRLIRQDRRSKTAAKVETKQVNW